MRNDMRIGEYREEIQGRPASKIAIDLDKRSEYPLTATSSGSSGITNNLLLWYSGLIDGGDMDSLSPAMDYLDQDLDGGTL